MVLGSSPIIPGAHWIFYGFRGFPRKFIGKLAEARAFLCPKGAFPLEFPFSKDLGEAFFDSWHMADTLFIGQEALKMQKALSRMV